MELKRAITRQNTTANTVKENAYTPFLDVFFALGPENSGARRPAAGTLAPSACFLLRI